MSYKISKSDEGYLPYVLLRETLGALKSVRTAVTHHNNIVRVF